MSTNTLRLMSSPTVLVTAAARYLPPGSTRRVTSSSRPGEESLTKVRAAPTSARARATLQSSEVAVVAVANVSTEAASSSGSIRFATSWRRLSRRAAR